MKNSVVTWSVARGLVLLPLVVMLLASRTICQGCGSWQPDFGEVHTELPCYHEQMVEDALLLLDCCALCTQDQSAMQAVSDLQQMLEDGKIMNDMASTGDWMASTSPDRVFRGEDRFSASLDHFIVLNGSQMSVLGYSSDAQASAVMMAGILAHEYFHCASLVNSYDPENDEWADPCAYYANEIAAYLLEAATLSCLVSCGCVNPGLLTQTGIEDIGQRSADVTTWRNHYENLFQGAGC